MSSNNLYLPKPVKVKDIYFESENRMLKTLDLEFVNSNDSFDFLPGQFCQLSILGKGEAPFGIASSPSEKDYLRFTINKAGAVTTALHYLQKGDKIGIRGPLGNYYPIDKMRGKNVLIIGGGFALTTLRSLAVYIKSPQNRNSFKDITLLYGARTPEAIIYRKELEQWINEDNIKIHLTVDNKTNGWNYLTGYVPDIVKKISPSSDNIIAIICGPAIMINTTLPILTELGFSDDSIYTSLERKMKCGIGKCGRCNIGSKYVCTDGPVFSYSKLKKLGHC